MKNQPFVFSLALLLGVYKTWARGHDPPCGLPYAHLKFCNFTNYTEKNNYLRVQGTNTKLEW